MADVGVREPGEAGGAPPRPVRFDIGEGGALTTGLVAILIFVLGVAVGFPIATFGVGLFSQNAVPVLAGLLAVLILVLVGAGLVFIFRQRIWQALFNRAQFEATRLATPLGNIARFAAERNLPEATLAARDFAEVAVARYSWILTRRWMVATLTALVVAIAAIAGAALLFQQNQLLRDQSVLLAEQNTRITEQTALLEAQIQLGEAQRSTAIVPEILAIGEAIGVETAALGADGRVTAVFDAAELSLALRARIVAATNSARPYRHLVSPWSSLLDRELIAAALARRTDLPGALGQYVEWQRANEATALPLDQLGRPTNDLTDRETSPERGQIIAILHSLHVFDTAMLAVEGANFSFAEVRLPSLQFMSFRHALLRFADFDLVRLNEVEFSAAFLEHARFRGTQISNARFSSIPNAEVRRPYTPVQGIALWTTFMDGTDFSNAAIFSSAFANVRAVGANFDGTYLDDVDFTGAELGAATFRNAVIYRTTFAGAGLASVDFDGAVVFDPAFLDALAAAALPETFRPERFELAPIGIVDVENLPQYPFLDAELFAAIENGGVTAYRIVRVRPFEDAPEAGGTTITD